MKNILLLTSVVLLLGCGNSLNTKWTSVEKKSFEETYCDTKTDKGNKDCSCMLSKVQSRYYDPADFFAYQVSTSRRASFLKYFRDDVAVSCGLPASIPIIK